MKITYFVLALFCSLVLDAQGQWFQYGFPPLGGGVTEMVVSRQGFLIATTSSYNFPSGQLGGIRVSTNQGFSWTAPVLTYTGRTLALGVAGSSMIYASAWNYPTNNEGLYRSITDGLGWVGPVYTVGSGDNIFSIQAAHSNTVFIGTRNGVLKSTNAGLNFTPVNNGIPPNSWVWDMAADSNYTLAAATSNGLFISTNLGGSWQQTTGIPNTDTVTAVEFIEGTSGESQTDDKLLAVTSNGEIYGSFAEYEVALFLGTFLSPESAEAMLAVYNNGLARIFVGTRPVDGTRGQSGGVYQSTDGGETFTPINDGLPDNSVVASLCAIPNSTGYTLYAGLNNDTLDGARVYRRNITVGVNNISSEIPDGFSLSQNYPNPFNPVTKFTFEIPEFSEVKISVFDLLGRELELLVKEKLSAGSYEVDFDATEYAGGVYFYKLESGSYVETRKMVVVK